MVNKKDFIWLYVSIASFLLLSISFLLMPIDSTADHIKFISILPGIMFWGFLALGVATQIILTHMRKKWISKNKRDITQGNRVGIISFMKNIPATIADVAFVLSVVGLVIALIATDSTGYVCYIFMAMSVFSFSMHCIFNGKNYFFIKNKDKICKALQDEQSRQSERE